MVCLQQCWDAALNMRLFRQTLIPARAEQYAAPQLQKMLDLQSQLLGCKLQLLPFNKLQLLSVQGTGLHGLMSTEAENARWQNLDCDMLHSTIVEATA